MDKLRRELKMLDGKSHETQCIWCGNLIRGIYGKSDEIGQHARNCKYTEEETFEKRMNDVLYGGMAPKCNCCGAPKKDDGTHNHDNECHWRNEL